MLNLADIDQQLAQIPVLRQQYEAQIEAAMAVLVNGPDEAASKQKQMAQDALAALPRREAGLDIDRRNAERAEQLAQLDALERKLRRQQKAAQKRQEVEAQALAAWMAAFTQRANEDQALAALTDERNALAAQLGKDIVPTVDPLTLRRENAIAELNNITLTFANQQDEPARRASVLDSLKRSAHLLFKGIVQSPDEDRIAQERLNVGYAAIENNFAIETSQRAIKAGQKALGELMHVIGNPRMTHNDPRLRLEVNNIISRELDRYATSLHSKRKPAQPEVIIDQASIDRMVERQTASSTPTDYWAYLRGPGLK